MIALENASKEWLTKKTSIELDHINVLAGSVQDSVVCEAERRRSQRLRSANVRDLQP